MSASTTSAGSGGGGGGGAAAAAASSFSELATNYWTNGWVVAEGLFSDDEVDQLAREAADGAQSPCVDDRCPSFRRLVLDPRVVNRVKVILAKRSGGGSSRVADELPEPLLVAEQCAVSSSRFRQDNAVALSAVTAPGAGITAWLALGEGETSFEYVSSSHREAKLQPHHDGDAETPTGGGGGGGVGIPQATVLALGDGAVVEKVRTRNTMRTKSYSRVCRLP